MSGPVCLARTSRGSIHGCGIPDGELCVTHRGEAGLLLRQAPLVLAWLRDIPAGLTRAAGTRGGRTAPRVPYDDRASAAALDFETRVRWACRAGNGETTEAATARCAAAWREFSSSAALANLKDAHEAAEAVLQPPGRWYAGTCSEDVDGEPCPAELYARTGRGHVTCRACGARHDLAMRRAVLLEAVADALVTASEFALAAPALLGEDVSPRTVRRWAEQSRILVIATTHVPTLRGVRTASLYRFGDVADVATALRTRRAA